MSYIDSLLGDIRQRATLAPESLFKQLSALGVGPLITLGVGMKLDEDPLMQKLLTEFVELLPEKC